MSLPRSEIVFGAEILFKLARVGRSLPPTLVSRALPYARTALQIASVLPSHKAIGLGDAQYNDVVQALFARGLAAGDANFAENKVGAGWLYNKVVFKKVQAIVGGKLRLAIAGSAPLSPGVQRFVQTAFNCPVRQGYGLTETCAGSCVQPVSDSMTGQVGAPTSSAAIKLADWAEGSYLRSDINDSVNEMIKESGSTLSLANLPWGHGARMCIGEPVII